MYDCVLDLYFSCCIHAKSAYVKFFNITSDVNIVAVIIILYH
jgi:hypothetical protein